DHAGKRGPYFYRSSTTASSFGGHRAAYEETQRVGGTGNNMSRTAKQRANNRRHGRGIKSHDWRQSGDHRVGHALGNVKKGDCQAGKEITAQETRPIGK